MTTAARYTVSQYCY